MEGYQMHPTEWSTEFGVDHEKNREQTQHVLVLDGLWERPRALLADHPNLPATQNGEFALGKREGNLP